MKLTPGQANRSQVFLRSVERETPAQSRKPMGKRRIRIGQWRDETIPVDIKVQIQIPIIVFELFLIIYLLFELERFDERKIEGICDW